jgi:hypothetical protein
MQCNSTQAIFSGNNFPVPGQRPLPLFLKPPQCMEQFNSLSLSDKRKFLWDQGRYVLTTDFYGARVKLFSLYTSFVEVYYHPVEKKVMRISIAGENELRKHLSNIRVPF